MQFSKNLGATYTPLRFEERLVAFSRAGFTYRNLAKPLCVAQFGDNFGAVSRHKLKIAGVMLWPVRESGTGNTHKNCDR